MKRAQTEIRTTFFLQRHIRRDQINNIVPASHLFYDFFTINQRLSLLKKSLYILLFYTFFYFPLFLHKKFGDKNLSVFLNCKMVCHPSDIVTNCHRYIFWFIDHLLIIFWQLLNMYQIILI